MTKEGPGLPIASPPPPSRGHGPGTGIDFRDGTSRFRRESSLFDTTALLPTSRLNSSRLVSTPPSTTISTITAATRPHCRSVTATITTLLITTTVITAATTATAGRRYSCIATPPPLPARCRRRSTTTRPLHHGTADTGRLCVSCRGR